MVLSLDNIQPCDTNELIRSNHETPFVVVCGYKVKKDVAPLLTAIFRKHGDIAKGSSFSLESRWCLLELVCSIYKKLGASTIKNVTTTDLKAISCQIRDLQRVKVKVGWLYERLNMISEDKEMYDHVKARSVAAVDEKKSAVEAVEMELKQGMDVVKKLQERLEQAKDEECAALNVADKIDKSYDSSLVHGLV